LLEDAALGNANIDDLFLRKVRKLIKHATVSSGEDHDFYAIDNQLMVLGTFLTVIGWAMLNACGSGNHNINSVSGRFAAESAFLNTLLSGSFSSFISILLKKHVVRGDKRKTPIYDIRSLCNGFLAGVAAVSAGSGTMKPWGALVTGTIASFLYMTMCFIVKKVRFDDPMENFQIYSSAGFWGMIASAFFIPNKGVLWGGKESGSFIGIQFLSLVVITLWALIVSWIYFFILKRCKCLRLKISEEVLGQDTI
jgi:ammonium transporter, Amt family